jgi:hypothetical protein
VTSILVRSYYIGLEIALNFLNAHWVEDHPKKLQ